MSGYRYSRVGCRRVTNETVEDRMGRIVLQGCVLACDLKHKENRRDESREMSRARI
jgi:hypothetical protein